jgi:hypothetical protein
MQLLRVLEGRAAGCSRRSQSTISVVCGRVLCHALCLRQKLQAGSLFLNSLNRVVCFALRWYFSAPSKFLGNRANAYGGTISFALGSFAGDFSAA